MPRNSIRNIFFFAVAIFFLCSSFYTPPPAWGFYAHRKINRHAVFTLPPEMIGFFKENMVYLEEHAVDPDMRRYASPYEAPRHYMDLDVYGEAPFETVPRLWTDALMRYSDIRFVVSGMDTLDLVLRDSSGMFLMEDTMLTFEPKLFIDSQLQVSYDAFREVFLGNVVFDFYRENHSIPVDSLEAMFGTELNCKAVLVDEHLTDHGILPYHLASMLRRLTKAFEERDQKRILHLCADFGHYIGDAHVPLHTTKNYNGQLTNQIGIHAFWESRLPELFAEEQYDLWTGQAELIDNPTDYFWDIVLTSHSHVDSVLLVEKELSERFPPDQQYCNEMRNGRLVKIECEAFAAAYQERLGSMVEERMRGAMLATGSAWYTAWVLAGQPDLSKLGEPIPAQDSTKLELEKAVQGGKILGREH